MIEENTRLKRIKSLLLNPRILGSIAGLLGGYLYYTEIGCKQGTCPITSNPWLTMLWGGTMGYLIGDMFRPKTSKRATEGGENPTTS